MKRKSRARKVIANAIKGLMQPNDWLDTVFKDGKIWWIVLVCILFFAFGIMIEQKWSFPHFYKYITVFLFIGGLALWAISHFSKKIKNITAAVANQPGAKKANLFYYRFCAKSPIYIIAPLAIALTFGVGGCSMFGALSLNPTVVWALILFFVVVYISIIGYLQYIVLAIYIRNLAVGSGEFRNMPKSMIECIPAQIEWLQELTKLTHTYRSGFFTLGAAYIVAYSGFCWLSEMQADTSAFAFYLLWGIIFLVIVLLFPVVSILEYCWIKRVVEQLKYAYVRDIDKEEMIKAQSNVNLFSSATEQLTQTLYAMQIINSKDYPIKSIWTTFYAALLSVFNFCASAVAVVQVVPNLLSALQQTS